ncbi:hypothetical protein KMT30_09120 [Streptomyces sp. IBSBF 2953]|nr:hypothetical protein [Streptomyces hayashii]
MVLMPGHPEWQGWNNLDGPPPLPPLPRELVDAQPEQPLSAEQRTINLDWMVNGYVARGWRLESRSPTQVVMARGEPVNHVLHAILTIFTCLVWGFVWLLLIASNKQERVALTVDQFGHVTSVQAPI